MAPKNECRNFKLTKKYYKAIIQNVYSTVLNIRLNFRNVFIKNKQSVDLFASIERQFSESSPLDRQVHDLAVVPDYTMYWSKVLNALLLIVTTVIDLILFFSVKDNEISGFVNHGKEQWLVMTSPFFLFY